MEAVILAGGFGTRLKCVVKDIPKPMADINGRPFLSYLIDYLSDQDINKILLSVGYKYEIIRDYFGLQYKRLEIEYVVEDKPLGTGGALKEALTRANGKEVVVLNGDTFFGLDLRKLVDFHHTQDSQLTIAVKPMHNFSRYGTVVLKGNRIAGFEEKSFKNFGYINGGVYVIKKEILEIFSPKEDVFSLEVDFFQEIFNKIRCFAFKSENYFIDIGIPEDYEVAQQELGYIFRNGIHDHFANAT